VEETAPAAPSGESSKVPPKPRDGSIVIDSEETVTPARIPPKPVPASGQQRAPW
jgi:hypothetical protein